MFYFSDWKDRAQKALISGDSAVEAVVGTEPWRAERSLDAEEMPLIPVALLQQ